MGFEPTISAGERPQTHANDRAATETDLYLPPTLTIYIIISLSYQLDAHILYINTLIVFLYMFRALLCSSSEGQLY